MIDPPAPPSEPEPEVIYVEQDDKDRPVEVHRWFNSISRLQAWLSTYLPPEGAAHRLATITGGSLGTVSPLTAHSSF
jgi:hypothetical protein